MPNRRYRSRSRSPAARYRWETQRTAPTTIPPAGVNFVDLTTGVRDVAEGANRQGITLQRMIGTLSLANLASANTEALAGVAQISDIAIAGLSFPPLATSFQWPWLWWKSIVMSQHVDSATLQIEFDIKSKRRYRSGDDSTVFLVENPDSVESFTWSLGLRMLFKIG